MLDKGNGQHYMHDASNKQDSVNEGVITYLG